MDKNKKVIIEFTADEAQVTIDSVEENQQVFDKTLRRADALQGPEKESAINYKNALDSAKAKIDNALKKA